MATSHTPGPFLPKRVHRVDILENNVRIAETLGDTAEIAQSRAERITIACNAHADLVALLEECVTSPAAGFVALRASQPKWWKEARAALAKVKP